MTNSQKSTLFKVHFLSKKLIDLFGMLRRTYVQSLKTIHEEGGKIFDRDEPVVVTNYWSVIVAKSEYERSILCIHPSLIVIQKFSMISFPP